MPAPGEEATTQLGHDSVFTDRLNGDENVAVRSLIAGCVCVNKPVLAVYELSHLCEELARVAGPAIQPGSAPVLAPHICPVVPLAIPSKLVAVVHTGI